jgi:hypothetical protein
MTQCDMCLDKSMAVLRGATRLFAEVTRQPAYDMPTVVGSDHC